MIRVNGLNPRIQRITDAGMLRQASHCVGAKQTFMPVKDSRRDSLRRLRQILKCDPAYAQCRAYSDLAFDAQGRDYDSTLR